MHELPTAIPDVNVLLALEPEELASKMLFLLRQRKPASLSTPDAGSSNAHSHGSTEIADSPKTSKPPSNQLRPSSTPPP